MIGENDGLSGTLALADALRQLGKNVMLVSDKFSSGLLAAGSEVFGAPFPMLTLSLAQQQADQEIQALLSSFLPTQVVAIERPGRAIDGHCYSMRGETLDDLVPAADHLLQPLSPRNFQTIAIGDGGNELGFGELIFCSTAVDFVIPAGISKGASARVATRSLVAGHLLLRPPEHEYAVLQALLAAGAVDGCTGKATPSVARLDWESCASTLAQIYAVTRSALSPFSETP